MLAAGAVAIRLWLTDSAFDPRAAVAWLRDLGLCCGAAGMKWRRCFVVSGLGVIPPTAAHTFFASALYEGVEGAKVRALAWAAAAGLVLVGLAWFARRRNRSASPS